MISSASVIVSMSSGATIASCSVLPDTDDRHARPLPGQLFGQQPHDLRIDGLRHDLDKRHAELLGQRFAELIHRDQAAAHQDAAQHAPLGTLRGKRRFELALGDIAAPNQDVAKSGHVGGVRGRGSGMSASPV